MLDAIRGRRWVIGLALATIAWNIIEAVVAISAGIAASSIALVGFGLDSVVEVTAAAVVLWQFLGIVEERERMALRLIGASFFLLAAYVAIFAIRDLASGDEPESSAVGIALTAISLVVMPALAVAKRRVGQAIGSPTVIADSKQTLLCVWLSASTLLGLVANAAFGWWWADPLAALAIAALAVNEGREVWERDDD
jgi:divalent metal cation (Fe/Co/Zn/Cd) transporter